MTFDPKQDYPIGSRRADLLETPSGVPYREVTLEAARIGRLTSADMRATGTTLSRQAEVARSAGRTQLAENLERAAELAAVPDDALLAIYTALRPGRSSAEELEQWAEVLDGYDAERTAAFVREAAVAYKDRDLVI